MSISMKMLSPALERLRPGEAWHTLPIPPENLEDVYEYLVWDAETEIPTESEIEGALAIEEVRLARKLAYPSLGDQLDSLGKALKFLKDNGTNIGPDGDAWIAALQQVKTDHPLP